jgi:transcription factor E
MATCGKGDNLSTKKHTKKSKKLGKIRNCERRSVHKFHCTSHSTIKTRKVHVGPKVKKPKNKLKYQKKKNKMIIAKIAKHESLLNKKSGAVDPAVEAEIKRLTMILSNSYVRQMLIEVGGENALAIIRSFNGNHSDEQLSKDLKLKISDVRATLNRLHNEGLVRYVREKDNETGWYSYSWSLNRARIEKWIGDMTRQNSAMYNSNGAEYYFCRECGIESVVKFEIASEKEFRCPDCNKLLEFLEDGKAEEFALFNRRK